MAMDPIIKAQWVKALRSGEYEQTAGYLRRGDSFCCLGVFCDILAPQRWVQNDGSPPCFDFGIYPSSHWWPSEFSERIGVPVVEMSRLSRMNDDGKSFREIADYIEANL